MQAVDKKKFNTGMGVTLIVLGSMCFGAAAFIGSKPAPPRPAPVSAEAPIDKESCRTAIQQLGYSASIREGDIVVYSYNIDDPEAQLQKASMAIALCKKLKLKTFCMGSECSQAGLSFTLKGGGPDAAAGANPAAPAAATPAKPAAAPAAKPAAPTGAPPKI